MPMLYLLWRVAVGCGCVMQAVCLAGLKVLAVAVCVLITTQKQDCCVALRSPQSGAHVIPPEGYMTRVLRLKCLAQLYAPLTTVWESECQSFQQATRSSDFGIPQQRGRLYFVMVRVDQDAEHPSTESDMDRLSEAEA